MFSTADRQAQIEEIVRRILSDVEQGVPLSEIALVHPLDQSYDELAAGVLERAGLPFYAASGRPVRRTAEGKAAISLLGLLCGEPSRGQLLEFLSLPCTRLRWVEPELRPRPRQWEAISKDLGLVSGWAQFDSLLSFSSRNRSTEDSEDRLAYATEGTETLLKVVRAFRNEAGAAAMMTDWTSLSVWFVTLLQRSLTSGHDTRVLDAIRDRIRLLAVLDEAGVPCDCTLFREAADQAIRRTTVSGGYFQRDGLFLGSIKSARGLRFTRMYLAECAERVFPPIVRQDPLLLDAEREALNQKTTRGFLSLKRLRLEEERLLFLLLHQAARERLVVSYSRRASLSGTPRLPSSLMLDAASRVSGAFQSIEEIERAGYDWFLRLPSRIGFDGHDTADALRALDRSDLRLHVLERAGNQGADVVAPFWPHLARARRLWRDRRHGRSFGPFDGLVPAEMVEQCSILSENLSATSLADYSVCPYRFFLSRVLKVAARREPEETLEMSPADVGSFAHRLLQCFVTRFLQQGGDWETYLQSAEETLAEIVEEELPTIAPGVIGLPVSWQIIRADIEADLRAYLAGERTKVGEGWRPVAAERWFEDIPVSAGAWTLRIRGAIDRLDRKANALRVIDYKTGRIRDKPDGYRTGDSLQLPLYLKAACYEEGAPQEISRAEFHFLTRRGDYTRLALSGDHLSDGRLEEVLSSMAEGISQGSFFYWPGPGRSNCRLCDFYEVCDTRVEQLANRKAPGSKVEMEPWWQIHDESKRR
jgi:ATP-dependent helicase/nuclease subunit B